MKEPCLEYTPYVFPDRSQVRASKIARGHDGAWTNGSGHTLMGVYLKQVVPTGYIIVGVDGIVGGYGGTWRLRYGD